MKIVQTFWSGSSNSNLTEITGGWLSPEYHWMSWALSCLQANRFFDRVELVTDNKGKEILTEQLSLPYSDVSTALEGALDKIPIELFSLAKLFTYQSQTEPFLHIDGDVFLFQKPSSELLASPLIAQNIDRNLLFYRQTLDKINEHFAFVPHCIKKEYYEVADVEAANAGVFGGSHLAFINEYCKAGFEFINRNRQDIDKFPAGNLNFIFEQYLLFCLAKEKSVAISYYIPDVVESLWYQQFVRFQDLPQITIAHPVGGFKKSQLICNHVARKLRKEYPDYYYRILSLMRHKTKNMHSRIYLPAGFLEKAKNITASKETVTESLEEMQWKTIDDEAFSTLSDKYFQRTSEAVRYFIELGLLSSKLYEHTEHWESESFINSDVLNNMPDGKQKEILSEVYFLDKERKNLIINHLTVPLTMFALYRKDACNYSKTQHLFSLSDNELLGKKVYLNSSVKIVDLRWELPFETASEFRTLLKKNIQEEETFRQVALIPNVLQLQIEEYYFDNLDSIVVYGCGGEAYIGDIISAASEFFDETEIETNRAGFKNLVISVLKRLCYANILYHE